MGHACERELAGEWLQGEGAKSRGAVLFHFPNDAGMRGRRAEKVSQNQTLEQILQGA